MIEEKNLPLVSVVVPCYNHEKYVKETIESILNQTYKNIELIVIDDGSKDNSPRIIQALADEYGFTFIHRSNKGLSATLNEGIKLSKGKYFSPCASDDIYIFDKIEKQVQFMESSPEYGMCYGKIIEFNEIGYKRKREIKNFKSGWIFEELLKCSFAIPAITVMIKKDIYNNIGLYDENLYIEDYDMWLRIANKYQIGFLNDYLAYYRRHETNMSKQAFKMYKAQEHILNKWSNYEKINKVLTYWHIDWFNRLARYNKKEAFKYLYTIKYIFNDIKILKGIIKLLFIWK